MARTVPAAVAVLVLAGALAFAISHVARDGTKVSVDDGSANYRPDRGLTLRYVLRNHFADRVNASSIWSLSEVGLPATWDNRAFEGAYASGPIESDERETRRFDGMVGVPTGRYVVTIWVRVLRHGVWSPMGSRAIGTVSINRVGRNEDRFRVPSGPSIEPITWRLDGHGVVALKLSAVVFNPQPDDAAVVVAWGLENQNPGGDEQWFEHPVTVAGLPKLLNVPANGHVRIDLTGAAAPPNGSYALRLALWLNASGASGAVSSNVARAYRPAGPVIDDVLLRTQPVRVEWPSAMHRRASPNGPVAISNVNGKPSSATRATPTVSVRIVNLAAQREEVSLILETRRVGTSGSSKVSRRILKGLVLPPRSAKLVRVPVQITPTPSAVAVRAFLHGVGKSAGFQLDQVSATVPLSTVGRTARAG